MDYENYSQCLVNNDRNTLVCMAKNNCITYPPKSVNRGYVSTIALFTVYDLCI